MDTIIQIRNLSKKYPGVQALDSVSFSIERGHVHALVGENGAGKSTLIKILSGAEIAERSSQITMDGQEYRPQNPKAALNKGISTIYQIMNLMPDRSIMHNILVGKEPSRNMFIDFDEMYDRTRNILAELNASNLDPNKLVKELKVGEKQIVEIAKALVNKCKLLVMDEATAALNQSESDALFKIVKKLRDHGVTILYVSHRLDEIFDLADDVTVLRDGKHILTKEIRYVSRNELVESMIGRKLENIYPKRIKLESDEEILRAEHIYSEGLNDVSFKLFRGEILAITGLSGCGKTELGKALYGDNRVEKGDFYLEGKKFRPNPRKSILKKIVFLPEDRKVESIFQEINILRNITMSVLSEQASNRVGIIRDKVEKKIASDQIKSLDIRTASMSQLASHLSGGNQQKVSLARCLAVSPDIYILLEPTQGIDVGVKFEIYQFINNQAKSGKSIILISSEIPEILGLSHRILIMREGQIVSTLKTGETSQKEILQYALGEK